MRAFEFTRHRGPITSAVWIPGTRQILTGGYDSAVARFDVDSGRCTLLGHHDHLVNRVIVDDDGRRAASVSSDYTVGLWSLPDGRRERVLIGHADDVEDFCFLPDNLGASVSRDRRILVWNLASGSIVRVLEGHTRDVLSVCADRGRLYSAGDDSTLRVWDIASGRLLHVFGPFETETDTCAIDTRRGRVVLGCDDGCLRVFDVDSGALVRVVEAHGAGIKKVACSPIDGAIVSAAYDQDIHVWDGRSLERRLSLEQRPTKWERSFTWAPDGRHIVAGTFDGTVLVWRAEDGVCVGEVGVEGELGNDCFNEVASDGAGGFVTVSDAGHLRLGRLDASGGAWRSRHTPSTGRMLMNAVTCEPHTNTVVAGAHDQRIHVFAREGGELRALVSASLGEGPINCVRVATGADGEPSVFAACYTGAIVRVGLDGRVLARIRVHDNAVKALRLHPQRPLGVSCSADGVLAAWTFDGEPIRRFPGHTAIIDDVDLDADGEQLASTGRDFMLAVYGLDDGALRHMIELGRRSPKALCFLSPSVVIVTNYWGELLRVDLAHARILRRTIARNGISSVTRADATGEQLLASSYDGAIYLVRAADLECVAELRAMDQRP